jgi:hypothetical protein
MKLILEIEACFDEKTGRKCPFFGETDIWEYRCRSPDVMYEEAKLHPHMENGKVIHPRRYEIPEWCPIMEELQKEENKI